MLYEDEDVVKVRDGKHFSPSSSNLMKICVPTTKALISLGQGRNS